MKTSSRTSYQSKDTGFSLIELMITLVIAGILIGIAVPSYSRYVVKSKRAAAYACLIQVGAVMEQVYADSFKYAVDIDGDGDEEFGSSGVCNATSSDCESLDVFFRDEYDQPVGCADEISANYTIRFGSITSIKFELLADPVADDFDPQCGELSLEQNGETNAKGSLGKDCFSE